MPELSYALDRERLTLVRDGAAVIVGEPTVIRVEGGGALQCLQGILTNDLAKPGDHSLVYGALLTPKGMIVVDTWVARTPDGFLMILPAAARQTALELLRRQLPPRLARATDLTGQMQVAWLVGGNGFQALVKAGLGPLPEAAGRVTAIDTVRGRLIVALGTEMAPFSALVVGAAEAIEPAVETLHRAGVRDGDACLLEASRILAGWPALGAEIDERTLPQEVRYDEIGGVSYTKGCYTGQETVARLHFRGHTNRELRGLVWPGSDPLEGKAIVQGTREVGTVRSVLALEDRLIGLAPLRREVAIGDLVNAGGREATVVALPFAGADLES